MWYAPEFDVLTVVGSEVQGSGAKRRTTDGKKDRHLDKMLVDAKHNGSNSNTYSILMPPQVFPILTRAEADGFASKF